MTLTAKVLLHFDMIMMLARSACACLGMYKGNRNITLCYVAAQQYVKGSLQYSIMATQNHCATGVVGDEAFQYPRLNFKILTTAYLTASTH